MFKQIHFFAVVISLVFAIPAAAQVPAYVPTDGLVGWWSFCGNAHDGSGNGHDGNVFETALTQDRFGNSESAYSFDGINDYIQVPHHPDLNSLPFSISFWMKADVQVGEAKIFNKVCCSSWNGWDININGVNGDIATMHFEYYNAPCQGIYQTYCSPVPYPQLLTHDDTWHHMVFSVDSLQARVYLDGVVVLTQGWDGSPISPVTSVALDIGRYGFGNNYFYHGLLDDIGIWSNALTEAEVLALFNAQGGGCAVTEPLFEAGGGVTDIDGNNYTTIIINNQEWMSENLNVTNFCNGDPITNASVWPEWYGIVEPRRCAYEANEAYRDQFGSIYNFWAVRDERNLCPCGWHVPSLAEYQSLETFLGGNEVAAGKIKGIETWVGENVGDLNASGLNMLAGGSVEDNFVFNSMGTGTTIWLSTIAGDDFGGFFADFRGDRTWAYVDDNYPMKGYYVRCVKDANSTVQIEGCTDLLACNYNDTASVDDGSCLFIGSACNDGNDLTLDDTINDSCDCVGTVANTSCTTLPSNLQQGLVGYWPFCGNANDESGNGNDGVVNGATLTEDRFGNPGAAYNFNGINNFIDLGSSPSLNSLDTNFSISAWVKDFSTTDTSNIISCHTPGFNWRYIVSTRGDSVACGFTRQDNGNWSPISTASGSIIQNEWTNIVVVRNNTLFQIFIDGVMLSTVVVPLTPMDGYSVNAITKIGINFPSAPDYNYFDGSLDDIGIWNRALTAEEVQELYTLDACTFTVYDTVTVYETVYDTVYTYETIYDTVTTYVTVTDTLLIDITLTALEGEPGSLNTVTVYPNPASDHITIDYGNFALMAGYTTTITDAAGATVYSSAVNSQQVEININAWGATGLYYLMIYDATGAMVAVRQIVLE